MCFPGHYFHEWFSPFAVRDTTTTTTIVKELMKTPVLPTTLFLISAKDCFLEVFVFKYSIYFVCLLGKREKERAFFLETSSSSTRKVNEDFFLFWRAGPADYLPVGEAKPCVWYSVFTVKGLHQWQI